ncbi:hypothetical protein TWF718_002603 [Orbilia javanica]|uniref:Uncharacterized protein n=1 Tax=Orbilia javanica TaxID=47235 RepID=A0AAN8MQP6_9PEZI
MATTPARPGNKWGGKLVNRSVLDHKDSGAGENNALASVAKEAPADLAPGLRPRPHPEVPVIHGDFKGVPPPPPPPGDAPILKIERKEFKMPPKTPKDPNAPTKPPAKINIPPQMAMMDELKDILGKKALKRRFEEPQREPPRKSPTFMDEMKAEMPGKIAKLKPVGNAGNVSKMKEDIEKAKARDGEHKKASPALLGLPKESVKPKEPARPKEPTKPKDHEKPKEPIKHKEFINSGKNPIGPPKKADPDKVESALKILGKPEAVTKIGPTVEIVPVLAETTLEEPVDPYILWTIRALGVLLIFLGLLKIEIYLWVISWSAHVWNELYV